MNVDQYVHKQIHLSTRPWMSFKKWEKMLFSLRGHKCWFIELCSLKVKISHLACLFRSFIARRDSVSFHVLRTMILRPLKHGLDTLGFPTRSLFHILTVTLFPLVASCTFWFWHSSSSEATGSNGNRWRRNTFTSHKWCGRDIIDSARKFRAITPQFRRRIDISGEEDHSQRYNVARHGQYWRGSCPHNQARMRQDLRLRRRIAKDFPGYPWVTIWPASVPVHWDWSHFKFWVGFLVSRSRAQTEEAWTSSCEVRKG